jgi:peptidoglycan/xylan/chitin deacetylase (PgdA/CDA1 family)
VEPAVLTTIAARKLQIANAVSHTPLSLAARRWESMRPLVRIFNYHAVPQRYLENFDRHLLHISRRFRIARADELERIVLQGPGERSVALFSFDDGLRNHLDAAALLEQYDATAFFSVPAAFPDRDDAWFQAHVYPRLTELHKEPGDLTPMAWEQIDELARRGHRICSHGFDHLLLTDNTDDVALRREIVGSREALEASLPGIKVDGFCWPGRSDPHATRAACLIERTYGYSFGTQVRRLRRGGLHDLPRINAEASWPLTVVDLQLSGILDVLYATRRLKER